jgi:hypothetical protein
VKICRQCGSRETKNKPFPKHRRICRKCFNKRCLQYASTHQEVRRPYLRQWRKKNPEKQRRYDLSYHYNLTGKELDSLTKWARGHCAACGILLIRIGTGLSEGCIDHNHKTNKFRAVICGRCNRALGLVKDKIDVLKKLIRYLKEHSCAY